LYDRSSSGIYLKEYIMRSLYKVVIFVALIASLALLSPVTPATATAVGPDVIANVYTGQNSYVAIFGADGSSRGRIDFDSTMRVIVSPNSAWVAATAVQNNREIMAYRRSNGGPVFIPVDAGHSVLGIAFTNDSRYFMYSTASTNPRQYVIGLVNLANGRRAEFTGAYGPQSMFGANYTANPFSFDGRTLLVYAFAPFSEGNFQGFFRINLTGYEFVPSGRYLMPPPTRILGSGQIGKFAQSPDRRLVAVLFYDPINPPQNYMQEGIGHTVNGLATVNVGTGQVRVIARAGQGQALETMSWTQDSRYIVLTGGSFQNTNYLVAPRLYIADATTGQVSEVGALTTDSAEHITDVQACGNTLYFTTYKSPPGGTSTGAMFAAPLNSPSSRQSLVTAAGVAIEDCASR
jgi:hypothetical protein